VAAGIGITIIPSSAKTLPGASRGVSPSFRSIKLYTFAYKFISKIYHLNEIDPSTPPLYRGVYHKRYTYPISALVHYLPLFLRPFYTLISINTTRKCLFSGAFLNSVNTKVQD
jgi:hypothetical protein